MSNSKLENLRKILHQKQLAAIVIPTSDAHKSEYIAHYWKTREWLTGFNGSAGTAVVTKNHAGLWTDSRYFVQAEKQLQYPFELLRLKTRQPEYINWLMENLKPTDKRGIDAQLFSVTEFEFFKSSFDTKNIAIVDVGDVFENLWMDRPTLPSEPITIHNEKFVGQSRCLKIEAVRKYLHEKNCQNLLVSALDDVAWLLNLRGNDVQYNPVFRAYVLVNQNRVILFTDESKLTLDAKLALEHDKIEVYNYNQIGNYLFETENLNHIEVDKNTLNVALSVTMQKKCLIIPEKSFITQLKAVKTNCEIEQYKNAQINDGIAMCNFFNWLEKHVKTGLVTEEVAAKKSEEYRSEMDHYVGLSFEVISAYEANAALPHYSPNSSTPVFLKPSGIYLIDSGAQYQNGTTDITRTIALGEVTPEQKTDYTLVLKGHIRLARAKFPRGTKGFHLDTLARMDLWNHNKDFGHGTGHGIGYFLNVHEGPHGFSQAQTGTANTAFEPGMLVTNEPGYYLAGKYGIRIENVMVCLEDETTSDGSFLKFETLTYCPYDINLIAMDLLTNDELEWINAYHNNVFNVLAPKATAEVKLWLKEKTRPLKS